MARGTRTLLAAALAAVVLTADPAPAAAAERRWHPPAVSSGRSFPVLLPADGRWLNWRNTYGAPRMRLINGTWRQVGIHQGIDIFAERGSPIVSVTAGTVENVGWTFYSGYRVGVRGADGAYYFYAHLLPTFGRGIAPGARVSPGQILGYMGSSGYGPEGTAEEFPPHLHFGLQTSGWVDPNEMLMTEYTRAVEAARGRDIRLRRLGRSEGALRSRLFSTVSVPSERISENVSRVRSEVESLERSFIR